MKGEHLTLELRAIGLPSGQFLLIKPIRKSHLSSSGTHFVGFARYKVFNGLKKVSGTLHVINREITAIRII